MTPQLLDQEVRICHTADGVRIAYASMGAGPVLVKAAHWLSHLEYDIQTPVWRHWLREFSRDHRLVRYDERGCGLSDWNVEFSVDAWVRDLEAVVDAAELDRFALLGVSQGGPVAINYAVRHPERVTHLVLYGTYARGWARRNSTAAAIAEHEALLTLMRQGWGRDVPAYREVFTRSFMPDANEEELHSFNELQRLSTSSENAPRFMETFGQIDVVDLLPRVTVPTLVLHARNDHRVPFEEGRLIAAAIPGSRFVSLDTRNHIMPARDPAWPTFLREVRSFLGVSTQASPPDGSGGAASESPGLWVALKQKKIFQWAIAYLAAAWITLQVLDVLQESWRWPVWLSRVAQVTAASGFLMVLLIAWYHGDRGEQRVRAAELIMIAILIVLTAIVLRLVIA